MFKEPFVQLKTSAADVYFVYSLCGYLSCVQMFRVAMIKVRNSDGVADDEFSFIFASLSMSFSLNPSLLPIVAFVSRTINRHLHFS